MCKACFAREKSIGGDDDRCHYASSYIESDSILAPDGDIDKCPRCGGKVFSAERCAMRSGQYHRKCFTCFDCQRALNASLATDGPNNEIYCQSCYNKLYGPCCQTPDVSMSYLSLIHI